MSDETNQNKPICPTYQNGVGYKHTDEDRAVLVFKGSDGTFLIEFKNDGKLTQIKLTEWAAATLLMSLSGVIGRPKNPIEKPDA